MELRLDSRATQEAIDQAQQLLEGRRLLVVFGDRLTLCSFALTAPVQPSLVGAATTEDEGFELLLRTTPDLLICSADLETGYGVNLLRRAKATLPTCQLLIVLVRETKAAVQEAMEAFADGVIFKSSLSTGGGDFMQALQTIAQGGVYYPNEIRRLGFQTPRSDLPALVEELSEREVEVVEAVARGLTNKSVADALGISVETVKTHVMNAMGKIGARDRTQLAVMAMAYGLIDPMA